MSDVSDFPQMAAPGAFLTETTPDHAIRIVGAGEESLPLVAFNLAEEHPYDEFDIAFQLAAERGWMVPAYTMPPNAQDAKMMRALVKLNLSRSLVNTLDDDIAEAIKTLEQKGPVSEVERSRLKTSVTH
jgi:glutamate decarboxylase